MVEHIRSPILILIELLAGLIDNIIQSFDLIYLKMVELFITLGIISGFGPLGFIVAVFVGSIVLFFILKFAFGSSKTLTFIFLFYLLLLILVTLSISTVG